MYGSRVSPSPTHIEQRRQALVGDLDVDVLEMDRVAEVLGRAVECLLHGAPYRCECYRWA